MTNCKTNPSLGAEATELYPEVKYTTVDEYLTRFIWGSTNAFVHSQVTLSDEWQE